VVLILAVLSTASSFLLAASILMNRKTLFLGRVDCEFCIHDFGIWKSVDGLNVSLTQNAKYLPKADVYKLFSQHTTHSLYQYPCSLHPLEYLYIEKLRLATTHSAVSCRLPCCSLGGQLGHCGRCSPLMECLPECAMCAGGTGTYCENSGVLHHENN